MKGKDVIESILIKSNIVLPFCGSNRGEDLHNLCLNHTRLLIYFTLGSNLGLNVSEIMRNWARSFYINQNIVAKSV